MRQVELNTSVGYLLKQTTSALHTEMEAVLRPLALTITQYSCLELLAQRPGLSNSELARGTFVTRQSMNVLLQQLEQRGLVTRAEQPLAGRVLPTELTADGRELRAAASEAVRSVEARMTGGLSADDEARLRELLTRCEAALGQ
jgi:DNA-binding MarR family transcriptional regulator